MEVGNAPIAADEQVMEQKPSVIGWLHSTAAWIEPVISSKSTIQTFTDDLTNFIKGITDTQSPYNGCLCATVDMYRWALTLPND